MHPRDIAWSSPRPLFFLALIAVCLAAALAWPAWAGLWLVAAMLPLIQMLVWLGRAGRFIDERIFAVLPRARAWPVLSKAFPAYKFVDILRAAGTIAAQDPRAIEISSDHREQLVAILSHSGPRLLRKIAPPMMSAHASGPDAEVFLPNDSFWILRGGSAELPACVIRVRLLPQIFQLAVEIAAAESAAAERLLAQILGHAASHSIYRGHLMRVRFGPEARAGYDEEDVVSPVGLTFLQEAPVTDATIVLEEATRRTLEHTIIDFHRRREALMRLGIPGKRGVLFYGPPGTGKTFTCRYLAHRLAPITTIVATGHALLHMKDIYALAAMLQPALVLLEDVDLVFASRELNAYNTVLGEFMDQLDGFGEEHEVLFVLTTNALERVEAAIKDRPGRISQCIYFGPPSPTLRRHYLERLLTAYPHARCSIDSIVGRTEGVSQAFLKELIYRGVQRATAERPAASAAEVRLDDEHIELALDEMLAGAGPAGRRILGFRIEA